MEMLTKFLHGFEWALAGAFGAFVSVQFHPEVAGRRQFILFVVTGSLIAHFLTGGVIHYFSIGPDDAGAVGFLIGAFGGSMVSAVVRSIATADIWQIVRSKLGVKRDD